MKTIGPVLRSALTLGASRERSPRTLRCAALLASILAVGFGAVASARAGTANGPSHHSLGLTITDSEGSAWNVNMSSLLDYNPSTGGLAMPSPGDTLAEGWAWDTTNPLSYRDANGNAASAYGLTWHTAERVGDASSAWKASFTFFATGNVDPFMTYAFSAKNNTMLNQTFTFTYGEALVPPITGDYSVYADVVGGVSNPSGPNGGPSVKIDPTIADTLGDNDGIAEIQLLRLSTDGGLTFTNAGVDVGKAYEYVGTGSSPYPLDSATLSGTTPFTYNYWEIMTQFTLSPSRDTAALSGFVEIEPTAVIPEPSTYATILGAAALGVVALKRRKSAAA